MIFQEEQDRVDGEIKKLVAEHNQLEKRKQEILKELLRLEGEKRVLKKLAPTEVTITPPPEAESETLKK